MNLKKITSIILAVAVITSLLSGCGNKKDVSKKANDESKKSLTIGVSTEYYPWCFKENDTSKGFEIDVWKEIGKRAGYDINFQTSKFSGLMGMLDAGKVTTVAHQVSTTEERRAKYDFSETYAYSKYRFVLPKGKTIKTLEETKGMKVGCVLGGNGEKTIKDLNKKHNLGLDIVTFDGVPMEKDIEIGRINAGWLSEVKARTTIKQGKLELEVSDVDTGVFEINQYPFKRDESNKAIIEAVNKAIKAMHEDGTFTKISKQWFEMDTTKEGK